MTKLIDSTPAPIHPTSRDAAFFQMIGDLGTEIGARQRRALEWSRFIDRLRSLGHKITIGSPA
jgi:hypothetical protein